MTRSNTIHAIAFARKFYANSKKHAKSKWNLRHVNEHLSPKKKKPVSREIKHKIVNKILDYTYKRVP